MCFEHLLGTGTLLDARESGRAKITQDILPLMESTYCQTPWLANWLIKIQQMKIHFKMLCKHLMSFDDDSAILAFY